MNVQELLESKQIHFIPKGNDYLVKCLNKNHEDRNPSMRIDRITGIFNCFSCAYKGNIFTLFGERPNELQMKRENLKKLINKKRAENVGLVMPLHAVPYTGDWRGIKPETYKKFGAYLDHTNEFVGRIMFPITDSSGRIVAFQGRHTSGGIPKYIFSPPGVRLPLFPKVEPIKGSVILVEGIFDVINLHDKGLTNAVCCFGTRNLNSDKLAILKIGGVESIDIFFDGDPPGQEGAENAKMLCEKAGLHTRSIYLKDTDPGDLTQDKVAKLYNKLYG